MKSKSIKRLFYIILAILIVVLMVLGLERMIIKSKVQEKHDEQIKSFKYNKKTFDDRRFYTFEYDLSDGRSCIAYLDNGEDRLLFSEIDLSFKISKECYGEKPDRDTNTIDVYNKYTKESDYIDLIIFGYNNGRYDEFLITFTWGEEIRVPISNEHGPFLAYEQIHIPKDYTGDVMDDMVSRSLYRVKKIDDEIN